MKIRKFLVLAICLGGLILSSWPVSFAFSDIQPSFANSSMSEPIVQRSGGTVDFYITSYISPVSGYITSQYAVLVYHLEGPDNAVYSYDPDWRLKWNCYSSVSGCSGSCDVFDLDGHLIYERTFQLSQYNSSSDTYSEPSVPYFPNILSSSSWVINGSLPDGMFFRRDCYVSAEPFVNFSVTPPQHNIYHSELSEPVADKYNRYFVLDDKLFWISIRVNGFWVKSADIEGSTGYYQYEALAPQQGGYEYGYQGVLAQYSGYVPVNLNYSGFFNSLPFDLVLLPSRDQWFIGVKSSSIFSDVQSKIDCEFFFSEFNLVDGEYISSSFVSFQRDNLSSASFPLSESGSFSDVRCYGVDFYNADNIPVNLSDVLWEYDLDFVLWRDDMLQRLIDIYNLLSEAESVTSYQAPDLASKMDDENIINDLSYNSGDVQQDLNDNIDRGIQALGSDGGVLQSLSSQIIALGNGKIFSLLIISLSLGILILILGKNKDD